MISLRRKIDESEHSATCYRALAKVFVGLTDDLPKAALPANPELSAECKDQLARVIAPLRECSSTPHQIDEAGRVTEKQFAEICRSNRSALEERDAAIKDVVQAVSGAISSFKSHGEKHNSSLNKVADSFDALARVNDVNELRRKLSDHVAKLRQSVEEMRREAEAPARCLEAQITAFQQRLEAARKGSGIDRLTGVGSRREAERQMQRSLKSGKPECILLFDIEDFRAINQRYGTPFGDKLLQALSHLLRDRFPDDGTLFRWGADEFLAITGGPLSMRTEQCRTICQAFAGSRYATFENGIKNSVSALVAAGVAEATRGESVEDWYRRARQLLERSRAGYLK